MIIQAININEIFKNKTVMKKNNRMNDKNEITL